MEKQAFTTTFRIMNADKMSDADFEALRRLNLEIQKGIPKEVVAAINETAAIQAQIVTRIKRAKALNLKAVERYNYLCYRWFPEQQDGEDFTKEEPQRDEEEEQAQDREERKTPKAPLHPYTPVSRFDFGEAIRLLKRGYRLSRDGWNGKAQYIALARNIIFDTLTAKDKLADHEAIGSQAVAFFGTSGVQIGWLASQADMLAEDWHIAGKEEERQEKEWEPSNAKEGGYICPVCYRIVSAKTEFCPHCGTDMRDAMK